jgi:hypothetical protein
MDSEITRYDVRNILRMVPGNIIKALAGNDLPLAQGREHACENQVAAVDIRHSAVI